MTDKELKRLTRRELLELLIEQSKENEQLQDSVDDLQKQLGEAEEKLKSKDVKLDKVGSLAEAALQLSGIFEAADAAAKAYVENIVQNHSAQQEEYDRIIGEAKSKAAEIIAAAEKEQQARIAQADAYRQEIAARIESFFQAHEELKDLSEASPDTANR